MSSSRKRKNRPGKASGASVHVDLYSSDPAPAPDLALFIQAHEADILRGPKAKQAADSLEVASHAERTRTDALIRWDPPNLNPAPAFSTDADDDGFASGPQDRTVQKSVWVDRYDARLLLDALPKFTTQSHSTPPSPSGWSDLPSDAEDTFFFAPSEAEDYRQEKRRKLMDRAREERLKARRAEDGEPEEEDVWGGSDEEPDEAQAVLMKRTAASIMSTSNPAQLEMRILANHGADRRFAFLRGRWKAAWMTMKRNAEKEEEAKKSSSANGLGNLADYGDSDEEEETKAEAAKSPEADLAARQARAKAWAESRRASKSNDE
ncbi:hypothetical protein C8R44DRAFT_788594 [Mycena epipterygia]|nr:hypothetical protein C8R44DRAFT_788594 [Mycena epipterygia]